MKKIALICLSLSILAVFACKTKSDLEARVAALEPDCAGTLWRNRWCENGDGTVTDLTNGAVWLQDARCNSMGGSWSFASGAVGYINSGECGLDDGSQQGDRAI